MIDPELQRNLESKNYTIVTGDGEVIWRPRRPHGIIVVADDRIKPLMRIVSTSDDEVANLSFRMDPEANVFAWEPDDDTDRNYQLLTDYS